MPQVVRSAQVRELARIDHQSGTSPATTIECIDRCKFIHISLNVCSRFISNTMMRPEIATNSIDRPHNSQSVSSSVVRDFERIHTKYSVAAAVPILRGKENNLLIL